MSKIRQATIVSSTIDSSPIGATTPSTGAFTGLTGSINIPAETPQQGPAAAIVGTGADVAVITFPALSAGRVQASKGMLILLATQHTVGTASVSYKLKLNGTAIETFSITPQNTTFLDIHEYWIFNNNGVSNAQNFLRKSVININTNTTQIPAAQAGTAAQDMTAGQTVTFTFNVANTDQVKQVMGLIVLLQ